MKRCALLLSLAIGSAGDLLAQTGRVVGAVMDTAGRPIQHAQVLIVGTNRTAVTDSLGRFDLDGVPAGRHGIRAVFIGYKPLVLRDLAIPPADSVRVELRLLPGVAMVSDEIFWACVFSPRNQPNVPRDLTSTRWRVQVSDLTSAESCEL